MGRADVQRRAREQRELGRHLGRADAHRRDGWYAEIRIPFRTLKFSEADPQTWGINFQRRLRRLNEDSYWSPLPRIYSLERVSLAGTIEGLQGLRPGHATCASSRTRWQLEHASAAAATDGDFDAGFDVKYGVTSGLTWDFTVNTDFSQVEADEQQVNLTRFSLFFPEKRDFFLENSGIFQFGAGDGGGGGGGGGGVGGRQNALAGHDRCSSAGRSACPTTATAIPILGRHAADRPRRPVLGRRAEHPAAREPDPVARRPTSRRCGCAATSSRTPTSASMLLNKDESGPHYNRVAGVDANFRFGFLNVNATTRREDVLAERGRAGQAATTGHRARQLQLPVAPAGRSAASTDASAQRFNDEMGFVPRRRRRQRRAALRRATRSGRSGRRRAGMREIRPHWQIENFTAPGRRRPRVALHGLAPAAQVPGQLVHRDRRQPERRGHPPAVHHQHAPGHHVDPGRYEFNEYFVLVEHERRGAASRSTLRYSIGEFYDGYRRGYTFGPAVRLNEHFNASVNVQINDIELPTASYVTHAGDGRVNYYFNTKMFVNALVQYNTDAQQWSSNVRFNIIHRPLSDIFLVYNERRDSRTGELIDRAVIAKMTYLMAF